MIPKRIPRNIYLFNTISHRTIKLIIFYILMLFLTFFLSSSNLLQVILADLHISLGYANLKVVGVSTSSANVLNQMYAFLSLYILNTSIFKYFLAYFLALLLIILLIFLTFLCQLLIANCFNNAYFFQFFFYSSLISVQRFYNFQCYDTHHSITLCLVLNMYYSYDQW